jgi:hypothetical protein
LGVNEVYVTEPRQAVDIAGMTILEASEVAVQPPWYYFVLAVIGFVGIMISGTWWSARKP